MICKFLLPAECTIRMYAFPHSGMFKMYAEHGEKKSVIAAAGKRAGISKKKTDVARIPKNDKPTSQASTQIVSYDDKIETKATNLPDERAIDIPSFPMKAAKHIVNGARTDAKKPATKKAKTRDDIAALVNTSDPRSFVRQRISKDFDGSSFYGTIMEYDNTENPAFWHVEYDDGDEEDFTKKDLIKALKHYAIHGKDHSEKKTEAS
jgi:hypothetical protein